MRRIAVFDTCIQYSSYPSITCRYHLKTWIESKSILQRLAYKTRVYPYLYFFEGSNL